MAHVLKKCQKEQVPFFKDLEARIVLDLPPWSVVEVYYHNELLVLEMIQVTASSDSWLRCALPVGQSIGEMFWSTT